MWVKRDESRYPRLMKVYDLFPAPSRTRKIRKVAKEHAPTLTFTTPWALVINLIEM